MAIKALFFDIDGTLVPFGEHGIPQEVKDALATLRSHGIKVFIATGRHPEWIDNINGVEFDGYVVTNGSMCLLADKKTCVFKHCIPQEDISRLINFLPSCDMPIVVVPADGGIFITHQNETSEEVYKILRIPFTPVKPIEEAAGKDVVQLMAFGSAQERTDSGIFKTILLNCESTSWSPEFVDIVPKGSNKWIGVEKLAAHFGITMKEVAAFGDGGNDIGMISHAGMGIAMGNAADDVKAVANYVTTDVTDHGIVNALSYLFPDILIRNI